MKHPPRRPDWRRPLFLLLLAAALPLLACGPDFPNYLLSADGGLLRSAPSASFLHELKRLRLTPPSHAAIVATNSTEQQTYDAEISDLRAALSRRGASPEDSAAVLALMRARRHGLIHATNTAPPIPVPASPAQDLPPEFAGYLKGAEAWNAGRVEEARDAWKAVLAMPAAERRFRSTWAAYMLGRSAGTNEWEEAVARYREVRSLAKDGFVDTAGLAAASYGWEAQVLLRRQAFAEALDLYLTQYAAGHGDFLSVRETVRRAMEQGTPEQFRQMARKDVLRRAVGAWLISTEPFSEAQFSHSQVRQHCLRRWLEAVEQAGVRDMASAEQLALASYQAGEMDLAARWIKRAPTSPGIQWLNAKLWLRAGKPDKAAEILSRIVKAFPVVDSETREPEATDMRFESGLRMEDTPGDIPAAREVLGELGAVRLARKEFVQSLDALLQADFWMDAAYVAERVLTVAELRSYVDRSWPEPKPRSADAPEPERYRETPEQVERRTALQIRSLLGRRLVRTGHADEAAPYLEEAQRAGVQKIVDGLQRGRDVSLPAKDRAEAWWQAAQVTRTEGMEVLGTEVGPDFAVSGGAFEDGVGVADRQSTNAVLRASPEELHRANAHAPEPDLRFHYRYVAAGMAWEAALLLPNNDPETARILCTAGSWLKARDPQTADVFYKTLVRRCRKTDIGRQADEMRWFPVLDASGKPIPWKKPAPKPAEPAEGTAPPEPPGNPDAAPEPPQ